MNDTSSTTPASDTIPAGVTQVLFAGDRRWWTIRARSDRYVILTRQREFRRAGEVVYTIVDWDRSIRGPADTLGQGWDFNADSLDDDAQRLLRALQYREHLDRRHADGETTITLEEEAREVSYRNNVPIRVEATRYIDSSSRRRPATTERARS